MNANNADDPGENFFEEGIPQTITKLVHRPHNSDSGEETFEKIHGNGGLGNKDKLEQYEIEDNILSEMLEEQVEIEEERTKEAPEKLQIESLTRLMKRRDTIFSILPSKSSGHLPNSLVLKYNFTPKVRSEDMIMTLTDEAYTLSFQFDDTTMWSKIVDFYDKQEEVLPEEKVSTGEESADIGISRSFYYQRFAELNDKFIATRIKNTLIHRRLALYFKRKNMGYVLQEGETQLKDQTQYKLRLNEYADTLTTDTDQRRVINTQLAYLEEAKALKSVKVKQLFHDLQQREKSIGTGLIFSKTAAELQEKVIQHLINRQQAVHQELSEMRLKYIKLKIMVSDKEEAIENLNHVDDDHHLSYFEKLTEEQKGYLDKIEEKEEELAKLRAKSNKTIQTLAHLREKIAAFGDDNCYIDLMFDRFTFQAKALRMQVNKMKKERDTYRSMYSKLRDESGLLQHPQLLDDMFLSMNEAKQLKKELEFLKEDCSSTTQKIRCIRRKMEDALEGPTKKGQKSTFNSKCRFRKTKGIPSKQKISSFPTITPPDAFDHLIQEFQPTVTRINVNK